MIEKIISYSVKNKAVIGFFVIVLIVWGSFSLSQLSIDAVPDITNNQVQILTTTRNLSTLDVEQFISYPIEMEMANLPGVEEIRSTSKFGLSVVTIVFKDEMGTYLPRQLISEKIKSASETIPEGFGTPEMGPITTGLGEIYQYIIDVKPGYEDQYTDMDLRTIQDWIVKRQLSGIDGVVEVNTWGGHLKQYEVSISPQRLKSMHVRVDEIMLALESNNSITGGGYIEKNSQSYFIRAEGLLKSIEDIQSVVVKNVNGKPICIRDIATVRFGHAPRFGAITGNGEGEKVMGQVMLLKDGNTKKVLADVIERVEEIQSSLPEGVFINPFLERSKLLGRTTFTIAENLILGALIVIFVVILLLGNFRSGLVIASIIPLSLLFALGMMNVFGVSANLMSLGAIDFGIIIDGAIIVVEFMLFSMTGNSEMLNKLTGKELRAYKDEIAIEKSSKMMRSAIFGQIIILIVFLPILTLQGVEGKMFRPMGMTFSFALIGAMLLCLTYVPMMSALVIRPANKKNNIGTKIIRAIQRGYEPILNFAMNYKKAVITFAALFLAMSLFVFSRMGAEFVPTLDEGDIVIQPIMAPGTSLGQVIELCTKMEALLRKEFTEVDQVVSRIGAAEVPTDPMSMEEVDMIITLKPISEWTVTSNKNELIEKINIALQEIPGMEYEFTQPIEMRFNELISGARSDISVKIYGENLDIIYSKALEAKELISGIRGASDITVDKASSMPQILIRYQRDKIAQYGLNISELNQTVQMAYAGVFAGEIYEGEKRFDLVMRYEEGDRNRIEHIAATLIDLPNGGQVPISAVAKVEFIEGPAKVSRDDAKRRVGVGVNVRGRDLESVVLDIKEALSQKLDLPVGYHVKYGGQFENLTSARQRLMVVVPMALVIIFLLLYMTFHSLAETVLVYTAIPLASTGGILLLWMRGMPFSISAGIGFIALFGIAVLNGIVLIEHYKSVSLKDYHNIKEMVMEATKQRIRPVLLTALAAALGFLPMAISTSSGAEVQRPLATAVIGGLISSTLLTLVVLPVLYTWLLEWREKKGISLSVKSIIWIPLLFAFSMQAQQTITLDEAIGLALEQHPSIQAAEMQILQNESLQNIKYGLGATEINYNGDGLFKENGNYVNAFGVTQNISNFTSNKAQNALQKQYLTQAYLQKQWTEKELRLEVQQLYFSLQESKERQILYEEMVAIYQQYEQIAKIRVEVGSANKMEQLSIASALNEHLLLTQQAQQEVVFWEKQLGVLLQSDKKLTSATSLTLQPFVSTSKANTLAIQMSKQSIQVEQANVEVMKATLKPNFAIGYSAQNYFDGGWLHGLEVGVVIPLFNKSSKQRINAQELQVNVYQQQLESKRLELDRQLASVEYSIWLHQAAYYFYKEQLDNLHPELERIAQLNYQAGEISYLELLNTIELVANNNKHYWEALLAYNKAVALYAFLSK